VTLRDVLDEAASELSGLVTGVEADGAVVWSRGGRVFAALLDGGQAAEFGLDPAVAAAAARTPDVAVSSRGAGWVRFSPVVLDDHGVDRAKAWFASAHRRAPGG
jgi:hypothetical protein